MAMKAYKSYKNVDLPWLKRVPEHWEVKRIRQVLRERKERNFPIKTKNILSLTNTRGVIPYEDKGNVGNKSKSDLGDYFLAYPGDIVLNSMNVVIGSVGLSAYFGAISPVYYALYNTDPNSSISYFNTIFSSKIFQKSLKCLGNGILDIRKRISAYDLKNVIIPVPPKEEQDQIVRYLDWQNSRLNKLINAKKKEIALLEEQKQALISQAVTKGLDPHAPLKDSGIDWIGQIPEHWLLCNLKYLCSMRSGKNLTSIQITENGPYPVYGGNGVRGYYSQYNVNSKCLIVGRQGALCGNVHYVNEKIWATDHAVVTQVYNFIHLKFFYYLLTAMNLNRYASQTAAQPGLAVSNILNQKVCFPPINEQRKIAVYLERQCTFIDNLIDNINRIISLLQEYRTRLVADVVTGQIDVRNVAIPNYETVTETIDQPETTEDDSTISAEDQ